MEKRHQTVYRRAEMKINNIRIKAVLFLVFVVLTVLLYFLLDNKRDHSEKEHLKLISKQYQRAYNTIYDQYKQLAENIRFGLVQRIELGAFYGQLLRADTAQKNVLRKELLSQIQDSYFYWKGEVNIKQLQFHTADNESFLRIHEPDTFGDDLTSIRETVVYVNRNHLSIGGYEVGRFYGGYRFVFPISADDRTHLGSMEVSFGPEAITSSLMKQYDILSNFFVRADVATRKVFAGKLDTVYKDSHHKNFFYDNNVLLALQKVSNRKMKALRPEKAIIDAIYANVHSHEVRSLYDSSLDIVFTTIPVLNPVTKELNAFLTIRSNSSFFTQETNYFKNIFLLGVFLFALTLFVFYQQYSRRKILAELNNSLEEKVTRRTQQLQRSKDEWEKTFDAIPDIITLQDRNMKIVRANQAAFDSFGMSPRELVGASCYHLFRCSSVPCGDCPGMSSLGDYQKHHAIIEHEHLNKIFQVTSAPIFDANGDLLYIVNVAQDITDKKKLEKELSQAQKMEAIGTLAGGIAHDFNNILAAILGYAEIIQPVLPAGSDEEKYMGRMIAAGNRATELVKQILTFSRSSSHKREALRIDLVVKEALKMMRSSLPKTIEIETNIDPNSGLVLADPTNVHQVVVNLCTNASHAIGKEMGKLTVSLSRIEITPEDLIGRVGIEAGPFVVLKVKDTGKGMAETTMERIFEPYFTTKNQGEGAGLGLAVTHGIVDKCQGFITVGSAPGEGTVFHVFLPCVTEAVGAIQDMGENSGPLPRGSERILVVDDEPDIVGVLGALLAGLGYDVTVETESSRALELFRGDPQSFDLVITDQTMPELTGEELSREILKIRPELPIIVCTGYTSAFSSEAAFAIGIKQFMMKPLRGRVVAEVVREIFDENSNL